MSHSTRGELERRIDALYESDPASFAKKRDALAKELKSAGAAEEAAKVHALRKPTQIAWVLNTLARRHPDAVAALVDVGRDLVRAQRQALRGEGGTSLRAAVTRKGEVVTDVTKQTAAIMRELGVDPTGHLDEIANALQAALADPNVGLELEEGRLEKAPGLATDDTSLEAALAASTGAESPRHATKERRRTVRAPTKRSAKTTARAKAAAEKQARAEERRARARAEAERKARARDDAKHARAVAAATAQLRAVEREARKKARAAERAAAAAEAAQTHARRLAAEAEKSARAVAEAKAILERA